MLIYGYVHYMITVPSKHVACQENTAGILFYKWIPETFTDMRSQIILRLDGLGAPPIELVQLGTERTVSPKIVGKVLRANQVEYVGAN